MFFELPPETCEAGGSGVPLSAEECDNILPRVLTPGPFVLLTDGAGAYQSVAPRDRLAFHTEERDPNQFSETRYRRHYESLKLSHGVVSHDAEQWSVVDSVKVITPNGHYRTRRLKKGTQIVDGLWPELRASIPDAIHTTDWENCRSYMWSWIWRMRRTSKDLLTGFGELLYRLRNCLPTDQVVQ